MTHNEALSILANAPLGDLALRASARREALWGRRVTFLLDTNPNYTNICACRCSFCAFYRERGSPDAYALSASDAVERVRPAVESGVTTILMQGGCDPGLPFSYYIDMVRAMSKAYPHVHLHFFSPPEVVTMARAGGMSVRAALAALKEAGLTTLPGGGAEILVDSVRSEVSPDKCSARQWLDVMEEAHGLGFRTTATMVFGLGERDGDIVTHLEEVRALQDRTGGFVAFIPWSFKPGSTPLAARVPPSAPVRYLRILALSRLFLDNVPHIQTSWFSEGKRTGQLGLLLGADDFGGSLFEENVLKSADFQVRSCTDEIIDLIRRAGFVPARRTTNYDIVEVYP
jgi:cyclic dehypoxanthinyl futalosine synthase